MQLTRLDKSACVMVILTKKQILHSKVQFWGCLSAHILLMDRKWLSEKLCRPLFELIKPITWPGATCDPFLFFWKKILRGWSWHKELQNNEIVATTFHFYTIPVKNTHMKHILKRILPSSPRLLLHKLWRKKTTFFYCSRNARVCKRKESIYELYGRLYFYDF